MIKSFRYVFLSMFIFPAAYSGNLIIDKMKHLSPDILNKLLGVNIEICDILISSKAEKIIGKVTNISGINFIKINDETFSIPTIRNLIVKNKYILKNRKKDILFIVDESESATVDIIKTFFDKNSGIVDGVLFVQKIRSQPSLIQQYLTNDESWDSLKNIIADKKDINIYIDSQFKNISYKLETNLIPSHIFSKLNLETADKIKTTIIYLNTNRRTEIEILRKYFYDNIKHISHDFILNLLPSDIPTQPTLIRENFNLNLATKFEDLIGSGKPYDYNIFISNKLNNILMEMNISKGPKVKIFSHQPTFLMNNIDINKKTLFLMTREDHEEESLINAYFLHNQKIYLKLDVIKKFVSQIKPNEEHIAENIYIATDDIKEVEKHLIDDTIVFLDYDQTIFLPEFRNLNGYINELVSADLLGVISKIKNSNSKVFVLTNRGKTTDNTYKIEKTPAYYQKITVKRPNEQKMNIELFKAGITLSQIDFNPDQNKKFEAVKDTERGYFNSIIFSAASSLAQNAKRDNYLINLLNNKGELQPLEVKAIDRGAKGITSFYGKAITALEFLRYANLKPKRIIFVDDTKEIATGFHEVMQNFGYDSVVIEYGKATSDDLFQLKLMPKFDSISTFSNIINNLKFAAKNNNGQINENLVLTNISKAYSDKEIDLNDVIDIILNSGLNKSQQIKCLLTIINPKLLNKSPLEQEEIADDILLSGANKAKLELYLAK